MSSSQLADRLRSVIGVGRTPPSRQVVPTLPGPGLEEALGGQWQNLGEGKAFVVGHRMGPDERHGGVAVGDLADRHRQASRFAPLLAGGAPARPPFVFVDLETTGLSGGAGTLAFLVACARFDADGAFVVRQYVLTEFSHERSMLGAVAGDLATAGTLVSFNGKSFDVPVLETRYLFHRLKWMFGALPHVDVLHPSRNFWGRDYDQQRPQVQDYLQHGRVATGGTPRAKRECSLVALEEHVLGVLRHGDVSGFEVPNRYFQFIRSGDARPLVAVLEHNRLDLLSLAGLSARILGLLADGAVEVRDACEALALGRLYVRAGLDTSARDAFERALSMGGSTAVRIEALRFMACTARRAREYGEAARLWRQMLDVPGCPQHAAREASEALAIHHEHRESDLDLAKAFALKSLDAGARPSWNDAVQHRLARIQRKMELAELPGLLSY